MQLSEYLSSPTHLCSGGGSGVVCGPFGPCGPGPFGPCGPFGTTHSLSFVLEPIPQLALQDDHGPQLPHSGASVTAMVHAFLIPHYNSSKIIFSVIQFSFENTFSHFSLKYSSG